MREVFSGYRDFSSVGFFEQTDKGNYAVGYTCATGQIPAQNETPCQRTKAPKFINIPLCNVAGYLSLM